MPLGTNMSRHPLQGRTTAAADIQDLLIAAPVKIGKGPFRHFCMAFIHPCQHLSTGFPLRSGRIALLRDLFLLLPRYFRHHSASCQYFTSHHSIRITSVFQSIHYTDSTLYLKFKYFNHAIDFHYHLCYIIYRLSIKLS